MHAMLQKINKSWLDMGEGVPRKKRLAYKEENAREDDVDAVMQPGDVCAFNFKDDLTTTTINPQGGNRRVSLGSGDF